MLFYVSLAEFLADEGRGEVYVCLDHDGFLPAFMQVTDGGESGIEEARDLSRPNGSIVEADWAAKTSRGSRIRFTNYVAKFAVG